MTVVLLFLLVGLLVLALLGRASLPYRERLPIRQWSGQDWTGNIGRGLRLLADAGGRRSAIMTQLTEQDLKRRRARRQRRQGGPEGQADEESSGGDARP
ncbi:hypothetical protein [Ornithinicoccus halotolerans]|uniref:hypothetical protein n=1 Tax=Ornithinicoccus halotolerans TaxID=1748220 RepID=UPI001295D7A6|nr:hypothetical protein [Ornithinicoccus halotolerans]